MINHENKTYLKTLLKKSFLQGRKTNSIQANFTSLQKNPVEFYPFKFDKILKVHTFCRRDNDIVKQTTTSMMHGEKNNPNQTEFGQFKEFFQLCAVNQRYKKNFWIKFLQQRALKKKDRSETIKSLISRTRKFHISPHHYQALSLCFNKELHEKENFQTHWPKALLVNF
ncbi:hypothetical protein T07_1219 [Trichinella nelsoni]|uniref:Uncharacterized protein n=1 Tax=Trichinella nelsoni TaxID=6336 RepID=A0A0V0RYG1_9BILA|nr:hypothetical protein T07_1219 [Trichinella nelsoni]